MNTKEAIRLINAIMMEPSLKITKKELEAWDWIKEDLFRLQDLED